MKKSVSFIILLVLTACSEKSDPAPEPIEFLEAQLLNASSGYEYYVFATDPSGGFLDLKPITSSGSVKLSGPIATDKINVTLVAVNPAAYNKYLLTTHSGVTKNSKMIWGVTFTAPQSPTIDSEISIEVKNIGSTSIDDVMITNGVYDGRASGSATIFGGSYKTSARYSQSHPHLVISSFRSGVPVYSILKDVKNAQKITLDYNTDFKACETIVKIPADGSINAGIYGWQATSTNTVPYYLGGNEPFQKHDQIGVPSGFERYSNNVYKAGSKLRWWYGKVGTPITADFKLFTDSIKVSDPSPSKLTMTTTTGFSYCKANYGPANSYDIHWKWFAADFEGLRFPSVPNEVKAKFPDAKFDGFITKYVGFVKNTDQTYQQYLTEEFDGKVNARTEYQEFEKFIVN
jgi:hypothetical protein